MGTVGSDLALHPPLHLIKFFPARGLGGVWVFSPLLVGTGLVLGSGLVASYSQALLRQPFLGLGLLVQPSSWG